MFQNQEKKETNETIFKIENESALKEEFEQMKKAHSYRYLYAFVLTWECTFLFFKYK